MRLKAAIALYLVCLVGLITGFLVVQAMEVPFALMMQGPEVLTPGAPATFRGQLIRGDTHRRVRSPQWAKLELETPKGVQPLGQVRFDPDGLFYVNATLPDSVPAGRASIVFSAKPDAATPLLVARDELLIGASAPAQPLITRFQAGPGGSDPSRGVYGADDGDIVLFGLPAHGELPQGLTSQVWLGAADRATGEPLRCEISLEEPQGNTASALPQVVTTNAAGLARIELEARSLLQWKLSARCGDRRAEAKAQWLPVSSQLALFPSDGWVAPGEQIRMGLRSIHKRDFAYVDLYDARGHWVASERFGIKRGRGGARLRAPEGASGVLYAHASHALWEPGDAWDALATVVAESQDDAIQAWLGQPDSSGPQAWRVHLSNHPELWRSTGRQLLRALAASANLRGNSPQVVINSAAGDRQALTRWKREVSGPLLWLIGAALALGFAAVGLATWQGLGRRRAQMSLYQEVSLELDEDMEGHQGAAALNLQTLMVLGTLALFGAALVFLLTLL